MSDSVVPVFFFLHVEYTSPEALFSHKLRRRVNNVKKVESR